MQSGNESLAWAALTRAPALSVAALSRSLDVLGSAQGILDASDAARRAAALPVAARGFLSSAAAAPTAAERRWLDTPRNALVPFIDARYPRLLRETLQGPIALYVAGNVDALNDPQLAVVGSRNPSPQGRGTAQEFCEYLAGRGLAICSGLAIGIDTAAHRGALSAQGVTLAVLGSGADVLYPQSNRGLAEEIRQQGALVSGFSLGTPHGGRTFRAAMDSLRG